MKTKCICGWKGISEQLLTAKNPFNIDETIQGCPKCFSINEFRTVCDELECWEFVTCGTPTKEGYRNTCSKHEPKE